MKYFVLKIKICNKSNNVLLPEIILAFFLSFKKDLTYISTKHKSLFSWHNLQPITVFISNNEHLYKDE